MAVNLAASLQSAEALKLLTLQPQLIRRTFLSTDLWAEYARGNLDLHAGPRLCCLRRAHVRSSGRGRAPAHYAFAGATRCRFTSTAGRSNLARSSSGLGRNPEISNLRSNAMLLRFSRGPHTVTVFPDGRALIQGTTDAGVARSLYARFIGS